tara:strand:+ start:1542 stop:2159 length:618 start_codon:yes stop_codon:yes gene_type:complete
VSYILQHRPLCLASSSPRRKELLQKFNLAFDCYSPQIDEIRKKKEQAESFVKRMAIEKARKVQQSCLNLAKDVIVLAGDTIVFFNGQILGKPKTANHAKSMLRQLNGNLHSVLSGYSILDSASGNEITDVVCTRVKFQKIPLDLLEWYVSTGEPMGKSGAYSIQGQGLILVESIVGSYNNVVGFPIENIISHMSDNGWISYSKKT